MPTEEIEKIRSSRRFKYDLGESCCCIIDEEILSDAERIKYKDCIGKLGVITHTFYLAHVFGFGYTYHHKIEFDGVLFDEYIITELLKDLEGISLSYLQRVKPELKKEELEKLGFKVYE